MNEEQRHALASIQFSSALTPDQVWSPLTCHVDGLHPEATEEMARAVHSAVHRPNSAPIGRVLTGERGVGKTHLLGWLREHVQRQGGSFFMPKIIDAQSFWEGAVHGIVNRLQDPEGGQLSRMLDRLSEDTGCDTELRMRLRGTMPVRRQELDAFIARVADLHPGAGFECQDTLRALVLFRARGNPREVGYGYLTLSEGIDEKNRDTWGFRQTSRVAQLVFRDVTRLFALTGPVVLAIDQIDSVFAQTDPADEDSFANRLAHALMGMREETIRTLIVVACLPKSWDLITTRGVNSAADRFTTLELSTNMPSAAIARSIIERHLGSLYQEIGFEPPHPTWPVLPTAFDGPQVPHFTPRRLLQLVGDHVRGCLAAREVRELDQFGKPLPSNISEAARPTAVGTMALDARFQELRATADVVRPLDPKHEDNLMLSLLNTALQCYVLEQGHSGQDLTVDQASNVRPALHARLRRTLDEATEQEEHWSFRAIAHNHHNAVLTRLRGACLEAGIQPGATRRHLVILRNTPFSGGRVTMAAIADFEATRGLSLPVAEEDLRTFSALERMLHEGAPEFQEWLQIRRPAGTTSLLRRVVGETTASTVPAPNSPVADPEPDTSEHSTPVSTDEPPSLELGYSAGSGDDLRVPLIQLRKHTAVFAGSGSGKTVLLRRMVEGAALHGVSSILIDTNNDLARLGDRWPEPPRGWAPGDPERAQRYFDETDVVVWTPRREAGRPLAMNPLPDFSGRLDTPDEFRTAIDASVAGLLPRTGLTSSKLRTGTAVLTETLTYFARRGGTELNDFVDLLANLPDGVSTVRSAARLAVLMADELHAAMINDPIFGGVGERLDPGTLLTAAAGKRARISVISCIGLPTDEQRRTFVNQLQLALFAWIKRNPAGDKPLGGLLVLDEAQTFAPSRSTTASTESTLLLATQARKYGLGLVFATQAPKALHNLITGNAATQVIGLLNASVQIHAAQELAGAKGSHLEDISRLNAGQFYASSEGTGFTRVNIPMCLSHHPPSALTEDEVLKRARDEGN
ncbi:ATP-binding protein [Nocardia panacis]|uniref:ATP-binding protein n=1 Tax=Nocardia panacis TaxID=2340916 RepID=A0A3A4KJN7_9NOCA|nr:ATP-binding protein [Nocardia panacis]RJO74861.1 ATP-binding protein [Nocardia panacis]